MRQIRAARETSGHVPAGASPQQEHCQQIIKSSNVGCQCRLGDLISCLTLLFLHNSDLIADLNDLGVGAGADNEASHANKEVHRAEAAERQRLPIGPTAGH
jgi:hypothetical protein